MFQPYKVIWTEKNTEAASFRYDPVSCSLTIVIAPVLPPRRIRETCFLQITLKLVHTCTNLNYNFATLPLLNLFFFLLCTYYLGWMLCFILFVSSIRRLDFFLISYCGHEFTMHSHLRSKTTIITGEWSCLISCTSALPSC